MRRPRVAMETHLYIRGPDGDQRCVYIYANTAGVYGAMKHNLLACLVGRDNWEHDGRPRPSGRRSTPK